MNYIIIFFLVFLFGCDTKEGNKEKMGNEGDYHINEVIMEDTLDNANPEVEKEKSNTSQVLIKGKENLIDSSTNKAVLWRIYREAKEKVKIYESQNKYDMQVEYLLKAAECAHLLGRTDIEAWQYNNAGYALIKKFKEETNYYNKMKHLNSLIYKSEISEYKKEIIAQMIEYKDLLIRAEEFLDKAKTLDGILDKSHRTHTIANNLLFIDDCYRFLGLN